jgi:hypothetical protein
MKNLKASILMSLFSLLVSNCTQNEQAITPQPKKGFSQTKSSTLISNIATTAFNFMKPNFKNYAVANGSVVNVNSNELDRDVFNLLNNQYFGGSMAYFSVTPNEYAVIPNNFVENFKIETYNVSTAFKTHFNKILTIIILKQNWFAKAKRVESLKIK